MRLMRRAVFIVALSAMLAMLTVSGGIQAQPKSDEQTAFSIKEHYTKYEYKIPMRDGKLLFTSVYVPKDLSKTYPMLMVRTPYSVAPYGVDLYPKKLGPSPDFDKAGYIFVFQDVRGRHKSEGVYIDMRPHKPVKKIATGANADIDESTDMFDSAEWLLKNVPNHNNRIGLWGISSPGFYVSASIIDSHPAIKAASPQAPVTDVYMNDDSYHGGAFMLAANFDFYASFKQQENPTTRPQKWEPFDYATDDGYEFYLKHGTLGNLNKLVDKPEYFMWKNTWQNDLYNDFWKSRNISNHLKNIKAAVLTVGGVFDAEDPQGPLTTFRAIEKNNPGIYNGLVLGPWVHGGWARSEGERIGMVSFASKTSEYYQKNILFPFFEKNLKEKPETKTADIKFAKAHIFETGTNIWRQFPAWPPSQVRATTLYFHESGKLGYNAPATTEPAFDAYISDPAKPVPYIGYTSVSVPQEYMVSDQRFASTRTDVLTYQTDILETDVTIAGSISPKLFVSTSGTDSDWVVKLIDVYPSELPDPKGDAAEAPGKDVAPPKIKLAGYQQLVRGEPFRGKYRNSWENPEPFVPNQPTAVNFTMPDVMHTFRRGHRMMVQVQSSWFPLTDRNPQVFMRIPDAKPEDFKVASQRVYRSAQMPSGVVLQVMPGISK